MLLMDAAEGECAFAMPPINKSARLDITQGQPNRDPANISSIKSCSCELFKISSVRMEASRARADILAFELLSTSKTKPKSGLNQAKIDRYILSLF